MARVQAAQGAGIVDLGAESSFDGAAVVGAADQVAALVPVVEAVADEVVVSVETYEPEVVAACLAAGARVLNLTGRRHEEEMLELAARHDAAVVMCFGETDNVRAIADVDLAADPVPPLLDHFGPRLERARALGVERLVVDPGIGFDYGNLRDPAVRARHQSRLLLHGFRLRALGVPLCNALPSAFDLFLDEVRTAEAFFGVLASLGGTHLFRTHEVPRVRAALAAMAALDVT
jgi:dihydropteroate synthase